VFGATFNENCKNERGGKDGLSIFKPRMGERIYATMKKLRNSPTQHEHNEHSHKHNHEQW
jgi:hypothetical protein